MYAVLNMGYTPLQYTNLNPKERAFVIACIQIKLDEEEKANRKLKSKSGRRKH